MADPEFTTSAPAPRPDPSTPIPYAALTPTDAIQVTPGQMPRVPRRQRVLPPPFRRNRIDISHHGREWQLTPATFLRPEDLVVDHGKIASVDHKVLYDDTEYSGRTVQIPAEEWIHVTFINGGTVDYLYGDVVRAFVEVTRDEEHQPGSLRETR